MKYTGPLLVSSARELYHSKIVIRNICLIILVFSLCFTFAGCKNRDSIRLEGYSAPYSVVFYSIPFASGDEIWDEAKLIETDQYGRELFSYKAVPKFIPAASDYSVGYCYIYALVVCQKTDENHVYYYEDQCYLLTQAEDYSAEDLIAIKDANDWNKPFDESKMTTVANTFDHSVRANEEACLKSFCDTVNIDERYKLAFDEITITNDEILCVIREYYSIPNSQNGEDYFFGINYIALFDKDNNLIRYKSFDAAFDRFPAEILAFKDSIAQVA